MNVTIPSLGAFMWLAGAEAWATSVGWRGIPDIINKHGMPALCLPSDARENFPVDQVLMAESYGSNAQVWVVKLRPGGKPLTLSPGECVVYGQPMRGYELDAQTQLFKIEADTTFVFRIHRVEDTAHINHFYSRVFCAKTQTDGSLNYVQWFEDSEGRTVRPVCSGSSAEQMP